MQLYNDRCGGFCGRLGKPPHWPVMSRRYATEEALNLILSDDSEADSDGELAELAEPMCPGSDEEFDLDADDQLFSFNQRYKYYRRYTKFI